jgi:hypothetical protein
MSYQSGGMTSVFLWPRADQYEVSADVADLSTHPVTNEEVSSLQLIFEVGANPATRTQDRKSALLQKIKDIDAVDDPVEIIRRLRQINMLDDFISRLVSGPYPLNIRSGLIPSYLRSLDQWWLCLRKS